MLTRFVLAAALAASPAAVPNAWAQADETQSCLRVTNADWQGCVTICTQLIGSGRYQGAALSGLLTSRGACYRRLGQAQPALADLNRAIALNPRNAEAFLSRSAVHGQAKRYDLSIADATQAIQIDASDARAYFNRCISYYRSGRGQLAVPDCRQAVQLSPSYAAPGQFLRDMCTGGVREAC